MRPAVMPAIYLGVALQPEGAEANGARDRRLENGAAPWPVEAGGRLDWRIVARRPDLN